MDILHQLGGLVLGSVPTAIFFIVLVLLYTLLVQRPLEGALAERRARTSGAVEQAKGAIAAAEAETTVYEDKLRAARAQISAERERRLKSLQAERDATLGSAREDSGERVRAARVQIEQAAAAARTQIEQATSQLSDQILQAVLSPRGERTEAHQ